MIVIGLFVAAISTGLFGWWLGREPYWAVEAAQSAQREQERLRKELIAANEHWLGVCDYKEKQIQKMRNEIAVLSFQLKTYQSAFHRNDSVHPDDDDAYDVRRPVHDNVSLPVMSTEFRIATDVSCPSLGPDMTTLKILAKPFVFQLTYNNLEKQYCLMPALRAYMQNLHKQLNKEFDDAVAKAITDSPLGRPHSPNRW